MAKLTIGHMEMFCMSQKDCNVKSELKIYVPEWKKTWVLEQFHDDGKPAAYFG
jgi:hypothetical protein